MLDSCCGATCHRQSRRMARVSAWAREFPGSIRSALLYFAKKLLGKRVAANKQSASCSLAATRLRQLCTKKRCWLEAQVRKMRLHGSLLYPSVACSCRMPMLSSTRFGVLPLHAGTQVMTCKDAQNHIRSKKRCLLKALFSNKRHIRDPLLLEPSRWPRSVIVMHKYDNRIIKKPSTSKNINNDNQKQEHA